MNFEAFINISGNSSGAQSAFSGLGNAAKSAGANVGYALKNIANFSQINNQVRANVNQAQNALADFSKALHGLATGAIVAQIYKVTNQFISYENQLYAVTGSQEAATKSMEDMMGIVKKLGADLSTSANGFVQMQAAAKGTGLSMEEVNQTFEVFSGVLTLMNADTLKIEGTFRALTQIMSKGVVQSEELRGQLAEHLPGAYQLAARALGKTTFELAKALKSGTVSSLDFIRSITKLLETEYKDAIQRAIDTPRAAYNRSITQIKTLMADIGVAFAPETMKGINAITQLAESMTDAFRNFTGEIKLATGAVLGYMAAWIAVRTVLLAILGIQKLMVASEQLFGKVASGNPYLKIGSVIISLIGAIAGLAIFSENAFTSMGDSADGAAEHLTSYTNRANGTAAAIHNMRLSAEDAFDKMEVSYANYGRAILEWNLKMRDDFNSMMSSWVEKSQAFVNNKPNLYEGLMNTINTPGRMDQILAANQNDSGIIKAAGDLASKFNQALIKDLDVVMSAFYSVTENVRNNWGKSFDEMEVKWYNWVDATTNYFKTHFSSVSDWWDRITNRAKELQQEQDKKVVNPTTGVLQGFLSIPIEVEQLLAKSTKTMEKYTDDVFDLQGKLEALSKVGFKQAAGSLTIFAAEAKYASDVMALLKTKLDQTNPKAFEIAMIQLGNELQSAIEKVVLTNTVEIFANAAEDTNKFTNKVTELKAELDSLNKNGLKKTDEMLVTLTADLEYAATVTRLMPEGFASLSLEAQTAINNAIAAAAAARNAKVEAGQLQLQVNERRKQLQSEDRETKSLTKSTVDLRKAIEDLRNAYLQMVSGIEDFDYQLREQGLLYNSVTDQINEYTDALTNIPKTITLPTIERNPSNEINANDAEAIARYRRGEDQVSPTNVSRTVDSDLQKVKEHLINLNGLSLQGINAQRQYLESLGTTASVVGDVYKGLGDIMIKSSLNDTDLAIAIQGAFESFKDGSDSINSASTSLDQFTSQMENGTARISKFGKESLTVSSSLSYIKSALDDSVPASQHLIDALEQLEDTYKSLDETRRKILEYNKLEQQQGYLTKAQLEAKNQLLSEGAQKLRIYNQQREAIFAEDKRLIESGKQVNWSLKLTDDQLHAVGSSYNSAASRAREYATAIANINQALQRGELTQLEATMAKIDEDIKKLSPIARDIGEAFDKAFESIISGSANASDAVKQMLKDIAAAVYKEFVSKQIISWIGKLFSNFGFETGGIMTKEGPADLTKNAFGNIMTSMGPVDLKHYASGGIANKAQLAMFGEGSQPEAYVPLPDGRTIPVTIKADNAQSNTGSKQDVKVIVNNLPGQDANVQNDGKGTLTIEIVRSALANDVNKGGVPWVGAMERRYGMNRGFAR